MPRIVRVATEVLADRANPQLIVTVEDEDGICGIGETWWGPYLPDRTPGAPVKPLASMIDEVLAPLCVGQDGDDIGSLWESMFRATYQYGPHGVVSSAIAGVDLALWDLAGRRSDCPVADLLGPRVHERLPAYASLHWCGDPGLACAEAQRAVAAGFRAVKLHERDPALVRAVRAAVGPEIDLMLDVSGRWELDEVADRAGELADLGLLWVEEPIFPQQDHRALGECATVITSRLAAGENEFHSEGFAALIEVAGASVLQPDLVKAGGLTPSAGYGALASAHQVWLCPHNFSLGPSLGANIHWAVTEPAARYIELPFLPEAGRFPGEWAMPTLDSEGCVAAPQHPGLDWA